MDIPKHYDRMLSGHQTFHKEFEAWMIENHKNH